MTKKLISDRMKEFDSSAIRSAFVVASQIKDPIDLSVGFPEDNTPDEIKDKAIEAIHNNHTRYTPSNGTTELRNAIAKKLRDENGLNVTSDTVSVIPGVTTGILIIYLAILNPGDEIIIPDPYFPPYKDLAVMLGATPVYIDTAPSFGLTAKQVKEKISPKTKAILVNSPNNPSGAIYAKKELQEIAKIAKRHGVIIISDEIYEHFTYDEKHFSIGSIYENTITLNGFSKAYAMTGWRLGYMAAPKEIIAAVNELLQYTVFSTNSISQVAGLAALKYCPQQIVQKYNNKRAYIIRELSPFYEITGGQGAFYFFLSVPKKYKNDQEFVKVAAEKGLIILPGNAFSQNSSHFRIAFGGPLKDIKAGVEILKKLA